MPDTIKSVTMKIEADVPKIDLPAVRIAFDRFVQELSDLDVDYRGFQSSWSVNKHRP